MVTIGQRSLHAEVYPRTRSLQQATQIFKRVWDRHATRRAPSPWKKSPLTAGALRTFTNFELEGRLRGSFYRSSNPQAEIIARKTNLRPTHRRAGAPFHPSMQPLYLKRLWTSALNRGPREIPRLENHHNIVSDTTGPGGARSQGKHFTINFAEARRRCKTLTHGGLPGGRFFKCSLGVSERLGSVPIPRPCATPDQGSARAIRSSGAESSSILRITTSAIK